MNKPVTPNDAELATLLYGMYEAFVMVRAAAWAAEQPETPESEHAQAITRRAALGEAFHNMPLLLRRQAFDPAYFRDISLARLVERFPEYRDIQEKLLPRLDAMAARAS
jgi:hypothetical protein